ncbi:MAG: hypothetical protein QXQ94_11625 [Candidatus Bathyarchaeia archaeon]
MGENERSFILGSKVGVKPSPKKLKQFIDRGGYAFLESIGEGKTSEEKQINGWSKHGAFSRLKDKTKISRTTLYRIAAWFPTIESTGEPKGKWIKEEDYKQLKVAQSELNEVEKLLKTVKEYFARSLCIDLMELRMRKEILGESLESFQLALKQQVEADEKKKTAMEETLDEALQKLQLTIRNLYSIIYYI